MNRWLPFLLFLIPALGAAEFRLRVFDSKTGAAVPARVLIEGVNGKQYVPRDAVVVPVGPDHWFVCRGEANMQVDPGRLRVTVERGPEYSTASHILKAGPGITRRDVRIVRWTDMKAAGYSSGESHLHVAAAQLGPMLAAEDLDFGNSLHWWNGPKLELPTGARAEMDLEFAGHRAPTSIFDAEVENSWGAIYLNGLKEPMSLPWVRARSNAAFARVARSQGALISYQGGYSREVLVDALNGLVDVVNVCNNNFQRFKYQPRSQYSNFLSVEGLPVYPNTPEGMMALNTESYYRLLNCGLKLAAGAESATGAKTTPVGYNRAYVKTGPGATLARFLELWRQGGNFVTNGPMVFLDADNTEPGGTIGLTAKGGTVRVRTRAKWDQPLTSLEIIANGEIVAKAPVNKDASEAEVSFSLPVRNGAWIAARATGDDRFWTDEEMRRFRSQGKVAGGEAPARLRFAHTSPIYVTVGGTGARIARSLAEAALIVDAFERYTRQTADPQHLDEIMLDVAKAREALRRLRAEP